MKRRMSHHEREALMMALLLPAIIAIGTVVGWVLMTFAPHR
jgi:hypothetical protein